MAVIDAQGTKEQVTVFDYENDDFQTLNLTEALEMDRDNKLGVF